MFGKILLGFVAIAFAAILVLMSGMGAWGGLDKWTSEWLIIAHLPKIILTVCAVGVDVAALGFLLEMKERWLRGEYGKAFACAAFCIALAGIGVFSSQSWLKSEFKDTWRSADNANGAVHSAKDFLTRVQNQLLSSDAKQQKAAQKAMPTANDGVRAAQNAVPDMPVDHAVKGNEALFVGLLTFFTHAAWFFAFGHGQRTASQDMALWARRHGLPRGSDRPNGPSDRQDRPQDSQDKPKMAGSETLGDGKIITFPHRTGRPSKSDILALVTDGWRHKDIAAKHGISVRTVGRYVAEARDRAAPNAMAA